MPERSKRSRKAVEVATELSPTATMYLVNRWSSAQFAATGAGVVVANLVVSLITRVVTDVPSTFVPLRAGRRGRVPALAD